MKGHIRERSPGRWAIILDVEHPQTGKRLTQRFNTVRYENGQTAANRRDIELIYDGLPEPIDLEIDHAKRILYWTDRGDPPLGNTVNRAPLDAAANGRPAPEIIFTHLMEGIGIALDRKGDRMFMTDLAGSVYSARLDGSKRSVILFAQGNLSGIACADLASKGA